MKNNIKLPSFYGIVKVDYQTIVKLRATVEVLKNNDEAIEFLQENLAKLEDVYEVKIRKNLGIISVNYNEEKISAAMMLGIILNILGLDEEIYKRKRSKIKRAIQDGFDILDITVYNKTKSMLDVKTIFALLFVGYGLKQIINKNPGVKGGRFRRIYWLHC